MRDAGFEFDSIRVSGLPRKLGLGQVSAVLRAFRSLVRSFMLLGGRNRPHVVLVAGGYVAVPVAVAAWLHRIPVVATEADAHLGLANRIAARCAVRLCTAYPLASVRRRQEVTGRPVALSFVDRDRTAARHRLNIPQDARVLLAFGGSGGARRINEAIVHAFADGAASTVDGKPLIVLHLTGRRDYDVVSARARQAGGDIGDEIDGHARYRMCSSIPTDLMPDAIAAADLVLTRSGGSVFEVAAVGRATIMVPSPHVTADHQTRNARHFVDRQAAIMVTDDECIGSAIKSMVTDLLSSSSDGRRRDLERALRSCARPNAARDIANCVLRAAGRTNRDAPLTGRRIHMLGIGGAGVSALAQVAVAWGADVDGCDRSSSEFSDRVVAAGVPVHIGHDPSHVVPGMDVVVSSAVSTSDPEILAATAAGCRVILRGEFLGELTRHRRTVVVAGAHGKSTTSAMIAHVLVEAGLDPTVVLGAMMRPWGSNARIGAGDVLVVEGDESDRTLMHLSPDVAVITNVENDHHQTFSSDAEVERLFADWVGTLGTSAQVVVGPGPGADRVVDLLAGDDRVSRVEVPEFDAEIRLPGVHNTLNARAAWAACRALGVPAQSIRAGLSTFPGIGRRFEIIGAAAGVTIVDDYSHNPAKVAAAIDSAREMMLRDGHAGRLLVVFQPHLYSRTVEMADRFASALADADQVVVLPIYAAREQPVAGVDSTLITRQLPDRVRPPCGCDVELDPATGDATIITSMVGSGDVVVTMGAGDVTRLGPRLLDALATGVPA